MNKDPMFHPEDISGQSRRVGLTSGIDVSMGSGLVDSRVVRRQENKAGGKIAISSRVAAAVNVTGIGGRTRGIDRKGQLVDDGISIGFHLLRRGDGGVPGAVGPRQTPDIVLTVDTDLLSSQVVLNVAEVSVSPVKHCSTVGRRAG